MKNIKYLLLLLMFSYLLQAQEHIYIPMAVILEDENEDLEKQINLDEEADFLLEKENMKKPTLEKKGINPYYAGEEAEIGESLVKNKKIKKIKKKKQKKIKKKKVKKEFVKEKYSGLKLKGILSLGTTATINSRTKTEEENITILDTDLGMGFGGGIEYFRNFGFMRNLEYGAGVEASLLSWDNADGVDPATNPGDPGMISVPIYLTMRYVLAHDIYIGARGGMHMAMKAGNVLESTGGIYYGLDIGKRFKNFGIELVYSTKTASIKEAYINIAGFNNEAVDRVEPESVDFETSGLSLNFYYLMDF